jgi:hypothetical protein
MTIDIDLEITSSCWMPTDILMLVLCKLYISIHFLFSTGRFYIRPSVYVCVHVYTRSEQLDDI